MNAIAPLDARIPESGMQPEDEYRSDKLSSYPMKSLESQQRRLSLFERCVVERENSQVCTNTDRAARSFPILRVALFTPN